MSAAGKLSAQAQDAVRRARRHFAPPRRLSVLAWAEAHRVMHSGPLAGAYFSAAVSPPLRGILEACSDPGITEVWCCKSSQIGWTQGVVLNVIGHRIHLDPCPIIVLFAKDDAARAFTREKLDPAIAASPALRDRVRTGSRSADSTWSYKAFPGGFIKLVGTNSPSNVKSTDAPLVLVEEPDDTATNVAGQGDAIALGRERGKTFPNRKMIVGGTPTIKGMSRLEAGMLRSDQRRYFVDCPHCSVAQPLSWANVQWDQDALIEHPIYGTHKAETARYVCPECGALWSEHERHDAIRGGRWLATAPFTGVAGFYLNELYSLFAGSALPDLVRKFLEATCELKRGNDRLMRAFVNNQLGEPWELRGDAPEVEELLARGENYAPWTCPAEGLVATAFVDVQRGGERSGAARLEYLVVAWGRGEESWRVARGVVPGNPLEPATWDELDKVLAAPIRNAAGGTVPLLKIGVDSGDGMTQEAVYRFVRPRQKRGYYASKGSSQRGRPIVCVSRKRDIVNDKAARLGLKLYEIGTDVAKDTIAARLKLQGRGPGRMHWPQSFGLDYVEQITAEVKMPGGRGREEWQLRPNRRNEMLDCEVGNLHAAQLLRLGTLPEHVWAQYESRMRQTDLLTADRTPEAAKPASGTARPFRGFSKSRRELL